MTVQFPRHGLPADTDADRLSERVARRIDRLEESAGRIDFAFRTAVTALHAHCAIDPQAAKAETWDAMVNAMQLGSALFAVTGISEGYVECRINYKVRTLPAVGPLPSADAGNWLTAFWLAAVCREPQRMTQLCEVPLERLRSPEGQYDEYVYHWVDTLQTYWLRRPGAVEKLTTTLRMSHPSVARNTPRDLLDGVLYPPIYLFSFLLRNDAEGFTPALIDALKLHQAYWTLSEERAADVEGSVALGPLAMAGWAYDGDMPLGVESEYLPKHLLQHSWLGEFPT
ncbi:immunity 49 family protein [Streptomyces sp. TRM76130]|nr:immunity 49 family protein [Streptomyces sp. TRM76130]